MSFAIFTINLVRQKFNIFNVLFAEGVENIILVGSMIDKNEFLMTGFKKPKL